MDELGLSNEEIDIYPRQLAWANEQCRTVRVDYLAGYQIVVPDQHDPQAEAAAEKLQHYVTVLTRQTPAIRAERDYQNGPAFFLGRTGYAAARQVDFGRLQNDGFAYYPDGENLIVAGGAGNGLLYGAYDLLELWGLRMFTSSCIKVPDTDSVTLPARAVGMVPQIHYRTTSYRDAHEPEYERWHRLSSSEIWGLFVHTFNDLVPPARYGETNPEYYSLIDGTRRPGTQLCLSNPEVLAVLIANLKEKIAANPRASYWSVSQEDNDQYCRCEACAQLNAQFGETPSGSILHFVNQVARAVPDKVISTLAYWYSRKAPQNIRAEPNVNIMLCNIESRRHRPVFETDPAFSKDLTDWAKLSDNILIWDYNIQFANLVSPFPNLHTIGPNIKFFSENHVNSLFMQANSQAGGEMAGLRAYLICKLMWDPAADADALTAEYLTGYYGSAGRFIGEYVDRMRESLLGSDHRLDIFSGPEDAKDAYLSEEMMGVYNELFDQAQKAVADEPVLLARVAAARLPLMYAAIQIGRTEVDTPRSLFAHAPDGTTLVKPEMKALVRQFVDGCKQDGVTLLRERSTSPDDYKASYERIFTKVAQMPHGLSFGKKITPITLPVGGVQNAQRLTDGLFGSWESWSNPDPNWVAYERAHVDFVIDLGELSAVRAIAMDFLNAQAQPDWNALVLPEYVTYALSADGETYGNELMVRNPHNPNPKENPGIAKVPIHSFRADLEPGAKARTIRVHAHSMLQMPSWHLRAGCWAWLYTDQIVVE